MNTLIWVKKGFVSFLVVLVVASCCIPGFTNISVASGESAQGEGIALSSLHGADTPVSDDTASGLVETNMPEIEVPESGEGTSDSKGTDGSDAAAQMQDTAAVEPSADREESAVATLEAAEAEEIVGAAATSATASSLAELSDAIAGAPTDGTAHTIEVSADFPFSGTTLTIPQGADITLQSTSGNAFVLTQDSLRHFKLEGALTLMNIVLRGDGTPDAVFGGIEGVADSLLTLGQNAIIEDCRNIEGGAVLTKGSIIMDGGEIRFNVATGSGGGGISIERGDTGSMVLKSGSVHHNQVIVSDSVTSFHGGGIYLTSGATLTIRGGDISYNAIYAATTTTKVCLGGGVYGGVVIMDGGEVHHNSAGTGTQTRGGGIGVFRIDHMILTGGKIFGNEATWGGGLYFYSYVGNVQSVISGDIDIYDNSATYGGGMIINQEVLIADDSNIMRPEISGNAKIRDNRAANGGGIMFYAYIIELFNYLMIDARIEGNVQITGNTATNDGGGIYLSSGRKSTVLEKPTILLARLTIAGNARIEGNSAGRYGGGARVESAELMVMGNAQISNNTAMTFGGAITFSDTFPIGSIQIRGGAQIIGNSVVEGSGGAIYTTSSGPVSIDENVVIAHNSALNGAGGALYTPLPSGSYAEILPDGYKNLTISDTVSLSGNRAKAAHKPPAEAVELQNIGYASTSIRDSNGYAHLINNYDINYVSATPLSLVSLLLEPNGGVGQPVTHLYINGSLASLPSDLFTRDGYTFSDWNSEADGKGQAYTEEDNLELDRDTVLFAQWVEVIIPPRPVDPEDPQAPEVPEKNLPVYQSHYASQKLPDTRDTHPLPVVLLTGLMGGFMLALYGVGKLMKKPGRTGFSHSRTGPTHDARGDSHRVR